MNLSCSLPGCQPGWARPARGSGCVTFTGFDLFLSPRGGSSTTLPLFPQSRLSTTPSGLRGGFQAGKRGVQPQPPLSRASMLRFSSWKPLRNSPLPLRGGKGRPRVPLTECAGAEQTQLLPAPPGARWHRSGRKPLLPRPFYRLRSSSFAAAGASRGISLCRDGFIGGSSGVPRALVCQAHWTSHVLQARGPPNHAGIPPVLS